MGDKIDIAAAMMGDTVSVPVEARPIEIITAEIQVLKVQVGGGIVEIGNRLLEAKAQLNHGEWLPWLEQQVQFSVAQANRFMKLAKEYSNSSPVTNLGVRKALALLAFEPDEREAFAAEVHVVDGEEKTVVDMTSRELERAIRERKEAVEAKELAETERKTAEQAREKMEQDMAVIKARLDAANEEDEAAAQREIKLKAELEKLRNRPIEVVGAAVPDAAALDAARAEGESAAREKAEQALQGEIEAAKTAKKAANEKAKELREKLTRVEADLTQEKTALTERVESLEKQLKVASNQDIAAFQVHFEALQEDFNRLLGCLQKLSHAGAAEDHDKLVSAMHAVLSSMAGKVPDKITGGVAG